MTRLRETARRNADLLFALVLFGALTALTWRRWGSFYGDLNREWTTPWRLSLGERLYRDVGFYYGPLGPELEGAVFRLAGARVGTAIAFGLFNSAATLTLILLASRRFLPLAPRLAVVAVGVGVLAFAPGSGTFIACYSQSALIAVALAWLAFLFADSGRAGAAGVAAGLLALTKIESGPALLGTLLRTQPKRWLRLILVACALAAVGFAVSFRGLSYGELVHYGPLRHLEMPPEFRALYRRALGLRPGKHKLAVFGMTGGACFLFAWLFGTVALFTRSTRKWWACGALLAAALVLGGWLARADLLSMVVRSFPLLLVIALGVSFLRSRAPELEEAERLAARRALAAALLGLGFIWRTFFWTVPAEPYPPLAAVSALPAICYLLGVAPFSALEPERRRGASVLALAPLLLLPVLALLPEIRYYREPRSVVQTPRGRWYPPRNQGELFASTLAHLQRVGVKDRSLVVFPEASAINFLLGARSPLRLEQIMPGHIDDVVDRDAVERMNAIRPERVVWVVRPTPEYGPVAFGVDYGRRLSALFSRDYVEEARFQAPNGRSATVYVRRDLRSAERQAETPQRR